MRYLPIVINHRLIPATLDGRKRRTRRGIQGKNISFSEQDITEIYTFGYVKKEIKLPFQKDDILWVKEEHYVYGWWQDVEGEFTTTGQQKTKFIHTDDPTMSQIYYGTDDQLEHLRFCGHYSLCPAWHKRLARFMPKKYARIFLRVDEVRAERLGNIHSEEAILEGIEGVPGNYKNYDPPQYPGQVQHPWAHAVTAFESLWRAINGKDSWDPRLWVWVVSFTRIEKPEGFI